jgi:PAS domain-containing protein
VTVFIDITDKKNAEQVLVKSRRRLELAIDAADHGFRDWDLTTGETYFSPVYYTMLGYENEELLRLTFEITGEGIWDWDLSSEKTYHNRSHFKRITAAVRRFNRRRRSDEYDAY